MSTLDRVARRGVRPNNEAKGKIVAKLPAAARAAKLDKILEGDVPPRIPGDVPLRIRITDKGGAFQHDDPELAIGTEHEVEEYYPPTRKAGVRTANSVIYVPPTHYEAIQSAGGDTVAGRGRVTALFGGTLHTMIEPEPKSATQVLHDMICPNGRGAAAREAGETFLQKRETNQADGETASVADDSLTPAQEEGRRTSVPLKVLLIGKEGECFGNDETLIVGSKHDVIEYFPQTNSVAVLRSDGGGQIIKSVNYARVSAAVPGSQQALSKMHPLYGGTLGFDGKQVDPAAAQPSDRGSDAAEKEKKRGKGKAKNESGSGAEVQGDGRGSTAEGAKPNTGVSDARRKDAGSIPAGSGPEVVLADLPMITLTLDELRRHPANRRPSQASIDARAESLREQGQLEPILVRQIHTTKVPMRPNGGMGYFYEILSGETRWLAAQKLGWPTIAARVLTECDDAQAFVYLAEFNAQREGLNAIEKAELIETLCKPRLDGGAGLTREAAAKRVGLATGAAASNLVRLLQLPPKWRERVASGELRQTIARRLTDFAAAPRVMERFEKSWQECHKPKADKYDRDLWESDVAFEENAVDEVMRDVVRLDQAEHYSSYEVANNWNLPSGKYKPLFELDETNRKKIAVETITIDGKPVEVAADKKEFMKLQKPLVKKAMEKGSKSKASKAADDDDRKAAAKPKPKTAAEQRAAAKLQAEQLAARIAGWRHKWLRAVCCTDRPMDALEHDRILKRFVGALLLADESNIGRVLSSALEEAFRLAGAKTPKYGLGIGEAWNACTEFGPGLVDLLWAGLHGLLSHEDRDVRYPLLPFEFVDRLAETLKVDVAKEWNAIQREPKKPRLEEFLLLHNNAQLDELAKEFDVYVADAGQKATKVARILGATKLLPLPKAIAPLSTKAKGKRGRK